MLTITLRRLALPAAALAASAALAFAAPAMAREAEPGDDRGGRVAATVPAVSPSSAGARVELRRGRGRDDAAGHVRRAGGRDDPPGHLRGRHGRDDAAGHR
ncbi:MAG: hypothetical protein QOK40_2620 [Miltoncostaeaceae bacterium]|jgi:hypothetical protein|nr:hypothetical protein [Miltoncostaeaceae bacterium]